MLVECLTYFVILAWVLGAAYATFYVAAGNNAAVRRNAEEVTCVLHAAEQWRKDIRRATGTATSNHLNGVPTWIIPQQDGEIRYHLEEGTLWRLEASRGLSRPVARGVAHSTMRRQDRHGISCYTWMVELKTRSEMPKIRPVFHFTAVPPQEPAP
jgi:hypothetical protein